MFLLFRRSSIHKRTVDEYVRLSAKNSPWVTVSWQPAVPHRAPSIIPFFSSILIDKFSFFIRPVSIFPTMPAVFLQIDIRAYRHFAQWRRSGSSFATPMLFYQLGCYSDNGSFLLQCAQQMISSIEIQVFSSSFGTINLESYSYMGTFWCRSILFLHSNHFVIVMLLSGRNFSFSPELIYSGFCSLGNYPKHAPCTDQFSPLTFVISDFCLTFSRVLSFFGQIVTADVFPEQLPIDR